MPDLLPQKRMPELDGLRGIAILLVWTAHYFAAPATGMVRLLNGYWFRLGWTGVDLFFVLSGFLIGGILLNVRDSPRYFRTFYARRFFRIIPVYYAWIAIYLALATFAGRYLSARIGSFQSVDLAILAHFLFLQNFRNILTSTVSSWWLSSTWSLAVEEQFYLVSPLVVRFLSRRALTVVLVGVTGVAPVLRWFLLGYFDSGPWLAYRLMPCRADSLAIGMLAAVILSSAKNRDWLARHALLMYGLFGILFAGVAYLWRWYSDPLQPLTQTIGYTWLALFFAVVLLLTISRPQSPVAALARFGFFREMGGVSYCIYIVHTTVFLFCHRMLLHTLPVVTDGRVAAVTFLAALITYAIAKLSWKFLEEPLLRRGHGFRYD
jgi:peptidoglycan/LPS O-acetylase OafA/YrhL